MFCFQCGKELKDGSAFCVFCGVNLKQEQEIENNSLNITNFNSGDNSNVPLITSVSQLNKLNVTELEAFLLKADKEATAIQPLLERAENILAYKQSWQILKTKDPRPERPDFTIHESEVLYANIRKKYIACTILGCLMGVILFGTIGIVALSNNYLALLILPLYIILLIFKFRALSKYTKDSIADTNQICDNYFEANRNQANDIWSRFIAYPAVPSDYRQPLLVSLMLGFVQSGKAESWKECLNLADEQIHRWALEDNTEEAKLYAQQAAIYAEAAYEQAKSANYRAGVAAAFSIFNYYDS
ncbi:hypothetical protein FACS1894105_01930 [Clostridia bacterium]|nr:hypothetical protein FACS1894105_01930 [Clostridia bacterium]